MLGRMNVEVKTSCMDFGSRHDVNYVETDDDWAFRQSGSIWWMRIVFCVIILTPCPLPCQTGLVSV